MRCLNCGSENADARAIYCERCGAALTSVSQPSVGQPVNPLKAKKTAKGMSLIILGIVLVIIGIVLSMIIFFMSVYEITQWNWDPWNNPGDPVNHIGGYELLTWVSYAITAVGGGLFVIGLIWLVIED